MNENAPDTKPPVMIDELAHQIRMAEVIDAAAKRLRGVCANMPEADFNELLNDIAAIAVKYEVMADRAAARGPAPP